VSRLPPFALLALLACEYTPLDTSPPVVDTQPPEPIVAQLVLYNAATATGAQGLTVQFPDGPVTTASDGKAAGEIPADAPFELLVQGDGYVDHVVFGPARSDDFSFITYVASQGITSQVLSMLGIGWDAGTGFVVVGVDYAADLSPVVGATVSLDAAHGEPFVFAGAYPALGATIPTGGMGFVSFPSVAVGSTGITVTPPDGVSCVAHPSGAEMPDAPVHADTVTVLAFHCG
jgi:hypothetical protein